MPSGETGSAASFSEPCWVLTLLVSCDLLNGNIYTTIGQAIRYGAFQVVSIVTTTGFATADYEGWPAMSQHILLACMFLGASAGSTGGGMKCLRIMLCFKYCLQGALCPSASKSHYYDQAGRPVGLRRCDAQRAGISGPLHCAVRPVHDHIGRFRGSISSPPSVQWQPPSVTSAPGFGDVGPVENYAQIPIMGKVGCSSGVCSLVDWKYIRFLYFSFRSFGESRAEGGSKPCTKRSNLFKNG